ncbi:MAG: methylaspartate ammonia-lyase [Clostridia bacterium]|nr:methylaspartate ammonia-lyase [Clostridia bacterium]MDY2930313.1 methylaspartate ammonia-lyase [Clostridiaceae bacterium]
MKIVDLVCSAGRTGFYFDDQRAIKKGAGHDGVFYVGEPVTEGFTSVRQPGESISVMLVLEDGQVAYGDCAAVQYSGAGGRDPLFLARDFIPLIEKYIKPELVGKEADDFRGLCAMMEAIQIDGKRLHTAIRYGMSQAILDAVAKATHRQMCEVVADEYGCTVSDKPIAIFTQSGDDRYNNADKMIIKGAQVLPHALINNVEEKLGKHGEKLAEYVGWLRDRILAKRLDPSYAPVLHIDVYGTIGAAFGNNNYKAMADYIAQLEEIAKPFHLRIEGPMDCDCDRETQIEALAGLTKELDDRGIQVELVADEWCNTLEDIKLFADRKAGHMIQIKTPDLGGVNNTIEAVLYCKAKGIGAYQGGTCNETDRSAQVCVQCAMATQPDQILAKPGMGVDEGFMIVYNEMNRILALRKAKAACKCCCGK